MEDKLRRATERARDQLRDHAREQHREQQESEERVRDVDHIIRNINQDVEEYNNRYRMMSNPGSFPAQTGRETTPSTHIDQAPATEPAGGDGPAGYVPTTVPEPGVRERYDTLLTDYAGTETNPETLLDMPAILDVKVPSTAAFHEALGTAGELFDDKDEGRRTPTSREIRDAVSAAEQAWEHAVDTAMEIGLSGLGVPDTRRVHRLVDLVFSESASTDERRVARDRLTSLLDEVEVGVESIEAAEGTDTPDAVAGAVETTKHLDGHGAFARHVNALAVGTPEVRELLAA